MIQQAALMIMSQMIVRLELSHVVSSEFISEVMLVDECFDRHQQKPQYEILRNVPFLYAIQTAAAISETLRQRQ
jgi:hypothetical protein